MAYLIDTDTIIYSLKGHEAVTGHLRAHRRFPHFISVITYGELVYGARKSQHPEKNLAVTYRVGELFRIIDIDRTIMDAFGELKASLRTSGTSSQDLDLLIGATALSRNLTLVTNNLRHFERIPGLKIENWAA